MFVVKLDTDELKALLLELKNNNKYSIEVHKLNIIQLETVEDLVKYDNLMKIFHMASAVQVRKLLHQCERGYYKEPDKEDQTFN